MSFLGPRLLQVSLSIATHWNSNFLNSECLGVKSTTTHISSDTVLHIHTSIYESVLGIWVILAPVFCRCSCTARGTTQSSSDWFTETSCEIYSWFPNQLLARTPAHLVLARSPCPEPKMMNSVLPMMEKKKQEREDQKASFELNWISRHYSLPCLSFSALEPCLVITTYDWEGMLVHRDPSAQLPGFLEVFAIVTWSLHAERDAWAFSKNCTGLAIYCSVVNKLNK